MSETKTKRVEAETSAKRQERIEKTNKWIDAYGVLAWYKVMVGHSHGDGRDFFLRTKEYNNKSRKGR